MTKLRSQTNLWMIIYFECYRSSKWWMDGDFSHSSVTSTQSKTWQTLHPSFVRPEVRDIQAFPLPSHSQTADRSLKDCQFIKQHWLFPDWLISHFAHAADVALLLPEVCTPTVFVHADFTPYPNIHVMFSDCSHFDVALFLTSSFPLISGIYCGEQDFIVQCTMQMTLHKYLL